MVPVPPRVMIVITPSSAGQFAGVTVTAAEGGVGSFNSNSHVVESPLASVTHKTNVPADCPAITHVLPLAFPTDTVFPSFFHSQLYGATPPAIVTLIAPFESP